MVPGPRKESDVPEGGYGTHMKTMALTILVMGISLALVIILWVWFGHIGPVIFFCKVGGSAEGLESNMAWHLSLLFPKNC